VADAAKSALLHLRFLSGQIRSNDTTATAASRDKPG
jgi:hypothetical protein